MYIYKTGGEKDMSKRAVRQYNRNGKFIAEYPTICAASDSTGVLGASISFACCGKYKTAGNYTLHQRKLEKLQAIKRTMLEKMFV